MQQACKQCSKGFEVYDEDLALLEKLSPEFGGQKIMLPPPSLCPTCRKQRRLTFRNESSLYVRKCGSSGKDIFSMYSPNRPYKVYDNTVWFSDVWNPMDYGRDYDPSRSFFEQCHELWLDVPQPALSHEENENCDFTNMVSFNKNCYMIFASSASEDTYYSNKLYNNRNIVDCCSAVECELCYECTECRNCYKVLYSQYSTDCKDSYYLDNCSQCEHCFGCSGLVHKQFHIFNEPYSKEDYFEQLATLLPASQETLKRFDTLKQQTIKKATFSNSNQNVVGDSIFNSKDCFTCFNATDLEGSRYCDWVRSVKDSMDYYVWGSTGELSYECHNSGSGIYGLIGCDFCWSNVSNLLYCRYCTNNTQYCFGCTGLNQKKYCILNKQYTKEQYEELSLQIIEDMKTRGEWGEFFPAAISPYVYNETIAQEQFPLTEAEVLAQGLRWEAKEDNVTGVTKTIPATQLPDAIIDIPDDILNWAITCEVTGRPFKIIKQELEFYRMMNLPVPTLHYDERYKRRRSLLHPSVLHARQCAKCNAEIHTTYSPDRPETVYCEACYLAEVY